MGATCVGYGSRCICTVPDAGSARLGEGREKDLRSGTVYTKGDGLYDRERRRRGLGGVN